MQTIYFLADCGNEDDFNIVDFSTNSTGVHVFQARVSWNERHENNICHWIVSSNLKGYSKMLRFKPKMGFEAEKQGTDKVFTLTTCKEETVQCYSMLFIESQRKNAHFNVTIRRGETKMCQFINVNIDSEF